MLKRFNFFHQKKENRSKKRTYQAQQVTISDQVYTIRTIVPDDIKDLLAIEREVYAGELPWTKTAFLLELQAKEPHQYLLVKKEAVTVGFIGCRLFESNAHITNVAVLSSYQGQGIGSFLINEMKQFAQQYQCEKLSLEVRISNKHAQSVYRKLGFVSTTIKPAYYAENGEDALEMTYLMKEASSR